MPVTKHVTIENVNPDNQQERVLMFYVALDTVERHIERVMRRAAVGGHSASERTLRRIHASSLVNLPAALDPTRAVWIRSESTTIPGLKSVRSSCWKPAAGAAGAAQQ